MGVGKDFAGDIWVVVRDSDKLVTFNPPVSSLMGTLATLGGVNVPVGPRPYVYGDSVRILLAITGSAGKSMMKIPNWVGQDRP